LKASGKASRQDESEEDLEVSMTSEMLTSRIEGLISQTQTKTILQQQLQQWQATVIKPKFDVARLSESNHEKSVQNQDNVSEFMVMR
jgi:hypothetical protein